MNNTFVYSIDDAFEAVKKIYNLHRERVEQELAEIITKYDFIVGSIECKHKLMDVLPEGTNIVYSPYIENPTMIYAIKKFDMADIIQPYNAESEG